MIVGILKEIKAQENRVCMTPAGVEVLRQNGHEVLVEKNAGVGSGFLDDQYIAAGAIMMDTPAEVFAKADMVMHVKEPQPSEFSMVRPGQIIFTYLHYAADEELTRAMMKSDSISIAYETVEGPHGGLPLLSPMSEVAGRIAAQEAAHFLKFVHGGRGVLMGGVTGVAPANVLVLGGGMVGANAAIIAAGMGAQVHVLDMNLDRLRYLSEIMPKNVIPLMSSPATVRALAREADAIIGAVLVVGAKAPKLVSRDMLKEMKPKTVLVDVAIDQGGCFETSHPTTHADPVFELDGILHYCVANIPGAVPMTSTLALTNATLPYAVQIANKGWKKACQDNPGLKKGLNLIGDKVVHKGVADAFGLPYSPVDSCL
ncbi:MAG: alanine dehydrogenase [Desulfovibrionales bacterium]|jgi:alanine dehydrogenase|nr:alanine dehydrogenase [Desulfovibrionales bacterium]